MMTAAQEKVWAALPSWWCLLLFIPAGLRWPDSSLCVLARPVVFPHALLPELNWWVCAAAVHFQRFFCHCVVFRRWYFFLYVSFALLDCACLSESLIFFNLFFLNESNECGRCSLTESSCSLSMLRHQPGSPALPGHQGHRGRLWSSFRPQHQPRLLTPAVWLCQRTGTVPWCLCAKSATCDHCHSQGLVWSTTRLFTVNLWDASNHFISTKILYQNVIGSS